VTLVTAQMTVSLDGFYAGPKQEDISDWMNGTEAAGFMRVTRWVIDSMAWRERLGYNDRGFSARAAHPSPTSLMASPARSSRRALSRMARTWQSPVVARCAPLGVDYRVAERAESAAVATQPSR